MAYTQYSIANPEEHWRLVNEIIIYINLDSDNKKIGLRQWQRAVSFLIQNIGQPYNRTHTLMRSYVGINYRYIDEYIEVLKEWGVLTVRNGMIESLAIPIHQNGGTT